MKKWNVFVAAVVLMLAGAGWADDFNDSATGNYGVTNVWGGSASPSNAVADNVAIDSHDVTINSAFQATNDWISLFNGGAFSLVGPNSGGVTKHGGTLRVLNNAVLSVGGGVTVNYAGYLQLGTGSVGFNHTNTIMLNAGSSIRWDAGGILGNVPGSLVVNSMATLISGLGGSGNQVVKIAGNIFPTAGALFLQNNRSLTINDAAYPTLTGPMVFSQLVSGSSHGINFGALNAGTASLVAFNAVGSGPTFTGLTLAGDLTIAGAGNTGFLGLSPLSGPSVGGVTASGNPTLTIAMSPAGAVQATSFGTTAGLTISRALVLSASNNQIGDVYLLAGSLQATANGALGDAAAVRTICLYGGELSLKPAAASTVNYANTALTVGPGGSRIRLDTSGSTISFGGAITLNGNLGLPGVNQSSAGTLILAGDISGPGVLGTSIGTATSSGKPVFVLSGNNVNWTGGIWNGVGGASGGGAGHLRIARAASAGTGPSVSSVVGNQSGMYLYLDTGAATSSVYSNDFQYNNANNPISVCRVWQRQAELSPRWPARSWARRDYCSKAMPPTTRPSRKSFSPVPFRWAAPTTAATTATARLPLPRTSTMGREALRSV